MSFAVFKRAFTSFGKHDPPYPEPGYINLLPIRESLPIPFRTLFISAPSKSHKLAISLIKLILVASMALAAYLVISAEAMSMKRIGWLLSTNGIYSLFIISLDFSLSTPTTIRSGFKKSSIAVPSLRNSGFEAKSNRITSLRLSIADWIVLRIFSDVPTGCLLYTSDAADEEDS